MASNDPGLAQVAAPAEDPTKGDVEVSKDGSLVEEERPVAPDQFDERYQTGKYEIWAYYAYYIGNNVGMSQIRKVAGAVADISLARVSRCLTSVRLLHRTYYLSMRPRLEERIMRSSTLLVQTAR